MNPEPVLVSDRPHAVEPLDAENNQLQVVGLTKIYRSNKSAVIAFEDLEFSLSLGEIGVVLGPSGCGKSSLLRCMAGLEPATQGTVRVGEQPVSGPMPQIGFVFQDGVSKQIPASKLHS
jgi:ABC-type nitrate/sulfonate/bicarbonate transport system ATPase subunit